MRKTFLKSVRIALLLSIIFLSGCGLVKKEIPNPVVTMEMANGATIKMELYPDVAPNTVRNFISLIQQGYYDGLTFHRVIPDFMIQGGDKNGDGTGGPGYTISGEFEANGFRNRLEHTRGVVSMARSKHPDSAGSQFFIMVGDGSHLDGLYAAFGRVLDEESMKTVDAIAMTERDGDDRPLEPQIIRKVTVDTFGEEYEEPEKIS
jgi:peptidyl-prolyl cis-trans isomerase B (cyclophilin B)